MPGATQSIIIDTPAKVIYDVVLDFKNYPKFLKESKNVQILESNAKSIIAEFEIRVIKTLSYTLDFKMTPHKKIVWSFIQGDLFKDNKGSWTFKPLGKDKTEAVYNAEIELGILVPKVITNMLVGSNLPNMLNAFKKQAERIYNKRS